MNKRAFVLERPEIVLQGTVWEPQNPYALVLIEHGMAEHHGRYTALAEFLAERGIAVYGYDKRGHGKTAGPLNSPTHEEHAGWIAPRDGWKVLIQDACAMLQFVHSDSGKNLNTKSALPLFYFGHSMGSFVVRAALCDKQFPAHILAGVILSGTASSPGLAGAFGQFLAGVITHIRGYRAPSPLIASLMTGPYAAMASAPAAPQTPLDWISSVPAMVDAYRNDPWCGRILAASFYRDMLCGLRQLYQKNYKRQFPRNLPILIYSGDHDPVGTMGHGVQKVYDDYRAWGLSDLQWRLFKGGRHEMHNEAAREEVFAFVAEWIETRVLA